jgi:acetyltransferase-like isoleucine patch superfamily enzyme
MTLLQTYKRIAQPFLSWIAAALHRGQRANQKQRDIKHGLLKIGEFTYGYPHIIDSGGAKGKVIIGNYCSIADGVQVLTGGNHHPEWLSTFPFRIIFDLPGKYVDGQPYTKGDVVIGSDVWIGQNALILSGVSIGHGSIVTANAICTRDIPDYAIVGGNPARIIRMRFTENQIQALLRISWWNWDKDKILKNVDFFCSDRVDAFIAAFDKP